MSTKQHHANIVIDPSYGGVQTHMVCPWDPEDPERPCWPTEENGERYSVEGAVQVGCVYAEYMSEYGINSFRGSPFSLILPVQSFWSGDCFEFYIGTDTTKKGDEK